MVEFWFFLLLLEITVGDGRGEERGGGRGEMNIDDQKCPLVNSSCTLMINACADKKSDTMKHLNMMI